jgi:hypothetical protein
MPLTTCLVYLVSTVDGSSKKTLQLVVLVAGTLQTLSHLYLPLAIDI